MDGVDIVGPLRLADKALVDVRVDDQLPVGVGFREATGAHDGVRIAATEPACARLQDVDGVLDRPRVEVHELPLVSDFVEGDPASVAGREHRKEVFAERQVDGTARMPDLGVFPTHAIGVTAVG